jgi:DNA-binding CsgD family transcriptional regulator
MARAEIASLAEPADPLPWLAAVGSWRETDWAWWPSYALVRVAEALLAAGRKDEARAPLREAWTTTTNMGARPLAERAEILAERARIDLGEKPAAGPKDALTHYGLTAREREVLLLMAQGQSNPQIAQTLFISPKTASVHVSNILQKLGLESRVQAAGLVARAGLSTESVSKTFLDVR